MNYSSAEKDFIRAIELDPNSDLAHDQYAFYLSVCARFDEAIKESKIAQDINPNSLAVQRNYGRILYLARRYDEAIIQSKRVIEVFGVGDGWMWLAYEMKGDDAQAYDAFMQYQKRTKSEHLILFRKAYESSGWKGVRQKYLELEKLNEKNPSGNYYRLARQCAILGDKEKAFEYLNKAIEKHHTQLPMLNVEPSFDILREDLRFQQMLVKIGFPINDVLNGTNF